MTKIRAADISYAQGDVDIAAAVKDGISAFIIRSGYLGKTDSRFHENMKKAAAAGADIGVYTYVISESPEQAVREALETVQRTEPYKGKINYPVFCDMEDGRFLNSDRFDKKKRTDIIVSFCETLRRNGWYPAVYINPAWLENHVEKERILNAYDIWLAAWTGSPDVPTVYDYGQKMWQWGAGPLSGVNGYADGDIVYVDYPSLIAVAGLNFLGKEQSVRKVFTASEAVPIKRGAETVSSCRAGGMYPADRIKKDGNLLFIRHAWLDGWSQAEGSVLRDSGMSYTKKKTTARLNVRAEPSASAEIVGILGSGDDVFVTADGEWNEIIYFGRKAFVFGKYVN